MYLHRQSDLLSLESFSVVVTAEPARARCNDGRAKMRHRIELMGHQCAPALARSDRDNHVGSSFASCVDRKWSVLIENGNMMEEKK